MFKNVLDFHEVGEDDGRVVYQLNEPLYWQCERYRITVPQYFYTDLASVPRLPLIYTLWGDRAHREAVLHDYLYRKDCLINDLKTGDVYKGCTREFSDDMFLKAMKSRSQPVYIRYPMWMGVRAGGFMAYHRMNVFDEFDMSESYHDI
jgi:hypothetical protein